jgi:serine/threonine protein kinase
VKLLSHMSHPYVLGYIDSFMHKNSMCIVTEYCDGGDLYTLLKVAFVSTRCFPLAWVCCGRKQNTHEADARVTRVVTAPFRRTRRKS